MTGEAEVAGCIQLSVHCNEQSANRWLTENQDKEIVDIKFSATEADDNILIIYRKED